MFGLSLFLIIALSPFSFAPEPMAHRNQIKCRSQSSSRSDWFKCNKARVKVKSHTGVRA